MTEPTKPPALSRNLRALLLLGIVLSGLFSLGGGVLMMLGLSRPEMTQPMSSYGQGLMLMSLFNLAIYTGILLAARSTLRRI